MITVSAQAANVLTRSHVRRVRVEAWRGDELLAEDVPVSSGLEDGDRTLSVPERVTLSVPRLDRGATWEPRAVSDPLNVYGQRLRVSIGIDLPDGTEWLQRGWYLIRDTDTDGDTVRVEAVGLLAVLDEARFLTPYQPAAGATLASAVRAVAGPAFPVLVDSALTDRAVPGTMAWDEDRLGALTELVDAWPAEARITPEGYLSVEPLADGAPVATLTDGVGGTVVRWQGGGSRDGAISCVVARGTAADGGQMQGVAYDLDATSPTWLSGPFNPLPVPRFFYSPLLTTVTQCRLAAGTILARTKRASARTLVATIVPNPVLELGDVLAVTGAGLTAARCVVNALSLPLLADGGPQTLTLGVL
jgi:hypothetical protein